MAGFAARSLTAMGTVTSSTPREPAVAAVGSGGTPRIGTVAADSAGWGGATVMVDIASTMALAVGNRSDGSLCIARKIIRCSGSGMSRLTRLGTGSGSRMCLTMTASGVSASNGTCPVAVSYRTTPSE